MKPGCRSHAGTFRTAPGGHKETLTQSSLVFNCRETSTYAGLFRMVLLSQFAFESVFARSRAVELPHDKAVFFNEIKDRLVFVRNALEPLVLVYMPLDNINLRIQDVMEMFAFVKHG